MVKTDEKHKEVQLFSGDCALISSKIRYTRYVESTNSDRLFVLHDNLYFNDTVAKLQCSATGGKQTLSARAVLLCFSTNSITVPADCLSQQ